MRILFTTVGLPGHFFPLVPLAWGFRSVGHEVLVTTPDHFVPTVLRSGLPVASSGSAGDFVSLSVGHHATGCVDELRHAHGRTFGRIAAQSLAGTIALVESWKPHLVVSERAEFAGPLAAKAHDVPFVEYQWGVAELDEYRSAATVELGLDALPDPVKVLNPWPPSLRLAHAATHQSAQYVPYNGDAHVPSWVFEARTKPRIAMTLGTLLPQFGEEGVRKVVFPLLEQLSRRDVEVVFAVDEKVAETWPPQPVRHLGRLPMAQVLRACDVLIHHGGQGTALTGLLAGRPQLVLPQIDDQWDNADAVVRAGAGLSFAPDQLDPETVAARCLDLVRDNRYRDSAGAVAAEMAAQPCVTEIVSLLEKMV